ncbi:MAG TPA: glutathione peroxidase [Flavobacterium sp.]|jgi:glutathione peroxidase|nr:glutathione peroxidase [Flavobacterium sp.]
MKLAALTCCIALLFSCQNKAQNAMSSNNTTSVTMTKQSIHQFKVTDLSGNTFDFASLKGKKVIVVNTASKCGLTPQYKDLETLYTTYKDKGLVIVGFPANNFFSQEPGTNEEIAQFCQLNYGVTFPMMAKVSVKGKDMCEVYQFLTKQAKNGVEDSDVEWNFQKYLLNENGELEKVISPRTKPLDDEIVNWVKG